MNEITMSLQADRLLLQALEEDISSEDVTTNAVMPEAAAGQVELICKQEGIIAGLSVFRRVFELLEEHTQVDFFCRDGDAVKNGQKLAVVSGDIRVLLSGERVALNYLQRMSGIATYTRQLADLLKGSGAKLLDTRKTTPNMRIFEKYAVRVGGGFNHRYNLSDGVLLKDNHISAAGSVKRAVEMAKEYAPFVRRIEVEAETPEMVREACEAGADIIMLDNMSDDQIRQAVEIIGGRAKTECSGNVTRENILRLASLGVDYISSGALTHSAGILDLSMKNLRQCRLFLRRCGILREKGSGGRTTMTGSERRAKIIDIIRNSETPVPGRQLASVCGVSRQVIVQDMALIRTSGTRILSTSRGYVMNEPAAVFRVFKVHHTDEQTEDELCCIVDLGGKILNVVVNHRVYGRMEAPLKISSRRKVKEFLDDIAAGKSSPLKNITSNYHYHTVEADSEEVLDLIEEQLRTRGYLVE